MNAVVKRRKKNHIHSTPERQEKTKAMKALWHTMHSRTSLTEFWRDYLQDLATESFKDKPVDPPIDPSAIESEKASDPESSTSQESSTVETAADESAVLEPQSDRQNENEPGTADRTVKRTWSAAPDESSSTA